MSRFTDLALASGRPLAMPVATFPGAKACGRSIRQMATDPRIQAEVSMALRERLGLHFWQSAMDLSVEAEAFGSQVRMTDDEVPTVLSRRVVDAEGVRALAVPAIGSGRTQVYLDTIGILASQPGDPFVVGGCIGPFTLAGRLFGVSESLEFAMNDPEATEELVEKATEFLIGYVRSFKAAGAKALFMAEPTAGLLSPRMLARFSSPFVRRIVAAVEGDGFGLILHNCGARIAHLPAILQSGATALHFGQPMDLAAAAGQVPDGVVVMGNLDPSEVFVSLPPTEVVARTRALMASCSQRHNVVFSSGCDIPPNAPIDGIAAFVTAVGEA